MKFKSAKGELVESYEELLKGVFTMRMQASDYKERATALEEEANGLFKMFAEATSIDSVESDVGTIRVVNKAGSARLDQKQLKEYLVKKGVDSDLVVQAFDKCTKIGKDVSYVGFFPPKGEDKK